MRTIRITYTKKPEVEGGHVVLLDETTADLLVPDDVDLGKLTGIISPDADKTEHYFLGHETTPRITKADGKTMLPVDWIPVSKINVDKQPKPINNGADIYSRLLT